MKSMNERHLGKCIQYELDGIEQAVLNMALHLSMGGRSADSHTLARQLNLAPERLQAAIRNLMHAGLLNVQENA